MKKVVKVVVKAPKQKKPGARNRSRAAVLVGRGDYATRGPFELMGRSGGAYVGRGLDAYLSGSGDYVVKSNSIMPSTSGLPNFRSSAHSHRMQGSEFCFTLTTGAANTFALQSYWIAPDHTGLFPMLSQLAANYTEFKFHGLVFEFRSTSASALNSTNTALGRVCFATNYNILAPNFTSIREMEDYEFSTSCKPSDVMFHPIECAPRETPFGEYFTKSYPNISIKNTSTAGSSLLGDPRFQNLGNFQIGTDGFQAANVQIAEVWAKYDIELLKPRLWKGIGNGVSVWAAANTVTSPTTVFGNCQVGLTSGYINDFGIASDGVNKAWLINGDGSLVTSGNYFVQVYFIGGGSPTGLATFTFIGNYKALNASSDSNIWKTDAFAASGSVTAFGFFKVTGPGDASNCISSTILSLPTGATRCEWRVVRLPSDWSTTT